MSKSYKSSKRSVALSTSDYKHEGKKQLIHKVHKLNLFNPTESVSSIFQMRNSIIIESDKLRSKNKLHSETQSDQQEFLKMKSDAKYRLKTFNQSLSDIGLGSDLAADFREQMTITS